MKRIRLRGTHGLNSFALVDDEDYSILNVHKWFVSSPLGNHSKYVRTRIGKISDVRMHRLIMKAKEGEMVDHINHNILDNRKSNLRFCTNQQNQYNGTRHKDKKTIAPRGISYDKTRPHRPWYGRISINGKRILTKGFCSIEDAYVAYKVLAKRYYGDFANFED